MHFLIKSRHENAHYRSFLTKQNKKRSCVSSFFTSFNQNIDSLDMCFITIGNVHHVLSQNVPLMLGQYDDLV